MARRSLLRLDHASGSIIWNCQEPGRLMRLPSRESPRIERASSETCRAWAADRRRASHSSAAASTASGAGGRGTSGRTTPVSAASSRASMQEAIRNLLLMALNSQFEGAAAGEVFNSNGKTDILIRVGDRNVFIGECKIWKGPKTITDTLDQLLGYLTWRDTKAALLLFIRDGVPTEIIPKALAKFQEHPSFKRVGPHDEFGERHDFVFQANGDSAREINLAFMPFTLPSGTVSQAM